MANSTNPAPSSAPLGTTSGFGSRSTTKAGVLGYILGLATAGILYLVTKGKGKRSNESGSARPMPEGEPTPLPPPSPAVDAHDGIHEVEEPTLAPAGAAKRKLTDEEVALIRAWYDGGVPAREIAARLGISVKTVYSRLRKNNNLENPKQDEQQ
jgi:DNA-directed RNA polymerase specialized sigma24 family protein